MEMKAHQWVEVAAVVDMVVLMEGMVRRGTEAGAAAEASVDVAAATIGDSIEVVEVDHVDEEAWGTFSGQVLSGRWMNKCMEMFCFVKVKKQKKKLVHVLWQTGSEV